MFEIRYTDPCALMTVEHKTTTLNDDVYTCGGITDAFDYKAWIDLTKECEIELPVSDPAWCLDHNAL